MSLLSWGFESLSLQLTAIGYNSGNGSRPPPQSPHSRSPRLRLTSHVLCFLNVVGLTLFFITLPAAVYPLFLGVIITLLALNESVA